VFAAAELHRAASFSLLEPEFIEFFNIHKT
jgi:hypothetical protein